MPLDAICLSAVTVELRGAILGGKVDKIYQPGRDEVVFSMRTSSGNHRLLLSANPAHPRAQLTEISRENPDKPPMFCMLLRKYLSGARVMEVRQPPLERVLEFKLEALDELGERVERRLILECMGRHSNLILLDGDGRIVDCLRRVDSDMSAKRQVLPGLFYRLPPAQAKLNLTAMTRPELEVVLASAPEQAQIDKWLLDTFGGLSPLICRELAYRAGNRTDIRRNELGQDGETRLLDALEQLLYTVNENHFTPIEIIKDNSPFDFTFLPIEQYETAVQVKRADSFGQLLDDFYAARETAERVRQRGQDMIHAVTNARDRTARRIALQEKELAAAANRERQRELGDIITSNLHTMCKGMSVLHAVDFYHAELAPVDIVLDPLLTPQQNAAKYYKEYNKKKTAEQVLTVRIAAGREELEYLNSVLEAVTLAEGEQDLRQIRQELVETGYMRRASKAAGREKKPVSAPMEFRSTTGLRISVGKNNTQNDLLTTKQAAKSDIWFHAQKFHGAHVILWTEGGAPDAQSLNEAAGLAAWFSQGRQSGKVPVDYTPVKYVKKPAGARPGMVVYTVYETALVTADEQLVKRLRVTGR